MRFRVGDSVTSFERQGIGRIERVRVAAGLCRVRWTGHIISWHPDEDLQPADGKVPITLRSWFKPRPLTPEAIEREARIQAVRDREAVSADGRR